MEHRHRKKSTGFWAESRVMDGFASESEGGPGFSCRDHGGWKWRCGEENKATAARKVDSPSASRRTGRIGRSGKNFRDQPFLPPAGAGFLLGLRKRERPPQFRQGARQVLWKSSQQSLWKPLAKPAHNPGDPIQRKRNRMPGENRFRRICPNGSFVVRNPNSWRVQ